eukprot:CAMPEP_0206535210 /NCGR_PEP_ID=MMETSP0325_2-20121206/5999_1 /ASSEMBLY_ACC=CAM_ASM_000347 /TAXON_ID=2866 /ORGANISM="Crypthecodinium cohnii, Strain Seligo" /LENGTH=459 /DNA_ID=CAMNT_0054032149 /DNA_START=83 /DNA_END=1465 /DNA_ORIENTATION=+
MASAVAAPTKEVSPAWRAAILEQCQHRDARAEGMSELYAAYLGSRCQLQQHLSRGVGQEGVRGTELTESERALEQEVEAMQVILKEREEELRAKEVAQAETCRQATQLLREVSQLREQLSHKTKESDQWLAELNALRQSEAAWSGGMGSRMPSSAEPKLRKVYQKVHEGELTCLTAASPQMGLLPSSLVAAGTADGFVKLIDGETGNVHVSIEVSTRQRPKLVCLDLTAGTGMLLAGCSDHTLRVLDLQNQKQRYALRGHRDGLSGCAFLKGCSQAYSASFDSTIKVWDVDRGQTVRAISADRPIWASAVHQGLSMIIAGHEDGRISSWDPRSGERIWAPAMVHPGRAIVGLDISPNGQTLATQADDGTVCLSSLPGSQILHSLTGTGPVAFPSTPAFSQDGSMLLARGTDALSCWRVSSGDPVALHKAQAPVCVCWSLSQPIVAHTDGNFSLWGSEER